MIFPIKEVKEKSLTSFFMKKCHIYDNVIVIYSERSKKTEYLGVFMAGSTGTRIGKLCIMIRKTAN